jgi:hypothetical protein
LHELGGIDTESSGDLQEVVEVEVALTALHLTEKGPVDADLMRHRLLRETESVTTGADPFAKDLRGWREWAGHDSKPIRPDYLCPERSHPNCLRPNRPYLDMVPPLCLHGRLSESRGKAAFKAPRTGGHETPCGPRWIDPG